LKGRGGSLLFEQQLKGYVKTFHLGGEKRTDFSQRKGGGKKKEIIRWFRGEGESMGEGHCHF